MLLQLLKEHEQVLHEPATVPEVVEYCEEENGYVSNDAVV